MQGHGTSHPGCKLKLSFLLKQSCFHVLLQECQPCVCAYQSAECQPKIVELGTMQYKLLIVEVGLWTCMTRDWSISWMAKCMPYSNCSFARVSGSPSEGRNYASELFTPWEGFTKKKKHHQLATHWEELCSLIICNSIFMGGFMQESKRVYT